MSLPVLTGLRAVLQKQVCEATEICCYLRGSFFAIAAVSWSPGLQYAGQVQMHSAITGRLPE